MSTFKAEVVKFELSPHPNADTLSIAKIKGWNCIVKTDTFVSQYEDPKYKNLKLAVYVPIDAIAPADHPLLGFLEGKKVKTVRLRGVISQGVLLPLKEVVSQYPLAFKRMPQEGDDLTAVLGIKKWEEPFKAKGSSIGYQDHVKRPEWLSKYTDIESFNNFPEVIKVGEPVHISEKLHGTSAIFALVNDEFFISSRNNCIRTEPIIVYKSKFRNKKLSKLFRALGLSKLFGKKEIVPPPTCWWTEANKQLGIESKLRAMAKYFDTDTLALYGEIVGPGVQDLGYGVPKDKLEFYAYDLRVEFLDDLQVSDMYIPPEDFDTYMTKFGIHKCPVLKIGKFEVDDLKLRFGNSTLANHVREGIVIKPLAPRVDMDLGRVILKFVSEDYHLRKGAKDF